MAHTHTVVVFIFAMFCPIFFEDFHTYFICVARGPNGLQPLSAERILGSGLQQQSLRVSTENLHCSAEAEKHYEPECSASLSVYIMSGEGFHFISGSFSLAKSYTFCALKKFDILKYVGGSWVYYRGRVLYSFLLALATALHASLTL